MEKNGPKTPDSINASPNEPQQQAVRWGCFELLRPGQIDEIMRVTPVAYLPWGALEWHGVHNPAGLDGLKARGLLVELARRCGGVVLPTVFAGTDTIKPFKGFPKTIDHQAETIRRLAAEMLAGLVDEGFKVIVLLMGHYGGGHVAVLREVVAQVEAAHPGVKLWAFPEWEVLQPDFPANHAALGETSFQLYLDPALVDLSLLPSDRVATLDDDGVWGADPRLATAREGAQMVERFLAEAVPAVLRMTEEARAT